MPSFFQRKPVLAVVAGIILLAGAVAGYWRYAQVRATLLSHLIISAEHCAVAFDSAELSALTGSRSDLGSPLYASVKDRLTRLRDADPQLRFVYILRRLPAAGEIVILADSEPATSKELSLPGDPYPTGDFLPVLPELMRVDTPTTVGPYEDAFGTWVSAYAPFVPTGAGQPRHVLGVDIPAGHWYRSLWTAAFSTAGYVWMLLILPFAALVSTHRQALQGEALRNLTEAMEQGHSPIMILDLGLRIEYANARFCRLLGYSRRELLGREWREFHGGDAHSVLTDLITTIRSGQVWTSEWMIPRKDGTLLAVRSSVTPVKNRHAQIRSFVGVFEDMTEVRRTEAVLREAKERAEAGDRAKGQFLATMSHEVRTPLNGIVGFASLLLDTPLSTEQQEYVDTIRTSSETLIQLTGDILDYAHIESGRLKLEPVTCDPRECIESALDLVAEPALKKGIELLHWVDEDVPLSIQVDIGRLRQVLVNLVNNAVKFTPSGEVEVRARTVRLIAPAGGGAPVCELEFSVRDTGIGIPPEYHPRMFRPFSQGDESTTRRYGGTGLGLAVCKNIVELMGGTIAFSSHPGSGSTFSFTIRVPANAEPTTPVPALPLEAGRLAVAIASDGLRKEVARLALTLGAHVTEMTPVELATRTDWDRAIVDVSASSAKELATITAPRPGLPPEKMIALVPIMLAADLRGVLRNHFHRVLSKPLHHGILASSFRRTKPPLVAAVAAPMEKFGLRVLIVEDNAVNERLIQRMVTHLGCLWTTAGNGRVALDELTRFQPDLVLMDLHMPVLDGLAATACIRAGDAGEAVRDVWIIALTADARDDQRERTFRAGANDYLTKPVSKEELAAAFQRYLSARRR